MTPSRSYRVRVIVLASLFLLGLALLGYRLYDLQVLRSDKLSLAVNQQHERQVKMPASRGKILDCNENILAHSVNVQTVAIDPQAVREEDARRAKAALLRQKKGLPAEDEVLHSTQVAQALSAQLMMPIQQVQQKLSEQGRYVILKKKVSEDASQRLRETIKQQRLKGVVFEDDQMRTYPNGAFMSHVLGYVNSEQQGVDGVELLMQRDLQGLDGWRKMNVDARGREIVVYRDEDFAPRNGYSVVLTLDQGIQNIVEQELDQAIQKSQPDCAVAIVMRPATGEILAMASRPTFDPNAITGGVDARRNRAISDVYEPGSTFKAITIAAALDQRVISLNDSIFCEYGKFLYAGRNLTDHESYGDLKTWEILMHSSNIGAAKIALMLGADKLYSSMVNSGFGEKALSEKGSISWPGEVRGIVHPLKSWSKLSITRIAMGHEVGATPLQMATAFCAIANGGNLMRPRIIQKVVDASGRPVREFFPQVRRRVVDRKAAQDMTEALKHVVSDKGTAPKAAIPGFTVAGKTGTAQKIVDGQYVHDKFVSSFIGYFPANNPEVCIYVMMDNPKGADRERYAGIAAAPIFHDIGVRLASYMNIKPEMEAAPVKNSSALVRANPVGGNL